MKYLLLVTACLSIYLLPFFMESRVDLYFYAEHSLLSLIVILLVCLINYKPLTSKIIIVELLAMMLDLFTCIEHFTSFSILNANYATILNIVCVLEALILILGAPWDAILKRLSRFYSGTSYYFQHNSWFL